MSHQQASRHQMSRNHKNGRNRGAQPRHGTGSGGGRRWPFFVGGLLLGLLIGGGIYLLQILPTALELRERARAADIAAIKNGPSGDTRPGDQPHEKNTAEKPLRFDFYTLLPQQEVVAPVTGNRTTTAIPLPLPANGSKPVADKPGITNTATTADNGRFMLQAGSFRTRNEADRRRGELLLSGHNVNVQPVTTGNNENWFRVMVGPFDGEADMQQARQQLTAGKIETLPIRLR